MKAFKLRAFPVRFVCAAALMAGCGSGTANNGPNGGGEAGANGSASGTGPVGTAGTSSSTGTSGSGPSGDAGTSSGGSPISAGTSSGGASGSGTGGAVAGAKTGGSGGSGGSPSAGAPTTGGSGDTTPPGMIQRPVGQLPNSPMPAGNVSPSRTDWKKDIVSPNMEYRHHINQPTVLNGYVNLNGNEEFWFWDIKDPKNPVEIGKYNTPNREPRGGGKGEGESESHTVSYGRYGNTFYEVTTWGHGVDIWDVTDQKNIKHVQQIKLDGIDYGDYTSAVWGMSWQGNYIYIGGTDNGLFILDAHDPKNVSVVKRVPTSQFGNVSAGPVQAIGNYLVIMTPKENGGIATMEISDPVNPVSLASIKPSKSYITQFYRHYAFMITPLRVWDVLSDPTNIGTASKPLGEVGNSPNAEYLSFGDDHLFLGRLRPDAGTTVYDISNPAQIKESGNVWGRLDQNDINDDQFSIMIGNLIVLGDDQEPYAGAVIAQWAADPDKKPPVVDTVIPKDKSTGVSVKSRIGISFSDNIEFTTVNDASFIVRPVGGEPLKGTWGNYMGVVNFCPNEDLKPGTTYEVVLPKGGVTDLVQNAIAEEFKSTFTTK